MSSVTVLRPWKNELYSTISYGETAKSIRMNGWVNLAIKVRVVKVAKYNTGNKI